MVYFHVWFSTKRRKWLLQGDVGTRVKELFGQVAQEKGIALVEHETMIDHVHLLLHLQYPAQLSHAMKLLKGRVSYELFREFPDVKMDAGVVSLWQDGYRSRIVPESQVDIVRKYIATQDERLEKYDW